MIRNYREGWHEARATFGNGAKGQKLKDITRHLANLDYSGGLCGEPKLPYEIHSWLAIAQRLEGAPICSECERLGKLEEANIQAVI